jgi:hypothetical protein
MNGLHFFAYSVRGLTSISSSFCHSLEYYSLYFFTILMFFASTLLKGKIGSHDITKNVLK